ncbi:hypothetical protein NECAME_18270 [Necator americanus]|uniref:Uncharacterized protein n=1 Tax=Necator americanus TaxID=51031 RepID=W2SUW3_NECAM|nr:hypothetical protein NECAME_18270 [Necator americanus]ETN73534.1 hypothetical protein NECAME_18270 [Necator americanus]
MHIQLLPNSTTVHPYCSTVLLLSSTHRNTAAHCYSTRNSIDSTVYRTVRKWSMPSRISM